MKLSKETVFKLALVTTAGCALVLSYFTGNYSVELSQAMEWHGYGSKVSELITAVLSVLWVLIPLLLFSYNAKARAVYLTMTIVGLGISLLSGVSTFTEVEMFLVNLSILADGVILTLAYTSLSDRFESSAGSRVEVSSN